MRTASSTLRTKILPSPILPVAAAALTASTALAADASSTTASSFTFGTKFTWYSRAPIDFGLALLTAVTLDLGHGQALDARSDERLADLVELEGFDDRYDQFHPPCSGPPTGRAPLELVLERVAHSHRDVDPWARVVSPASFTLSVALRT